MAHKQKGYVFENDWTIQEMKNNTDGLTGLVVPTNLKIDMEQMVLNTDKVKQYIDEAKSITIMDCPCRTKMKHCDGPLDVCITLNERADIFLNTPKWKYLKPFRATKEQAYEALRRANEAGLVHVAYVFADNRNAGKPDICSCCSCCCFAFGATLRYGLSQHVLKASAKSSTDESKCTQCGICSDRCHFGARKMDDNKLEFNGDMCFGCGLCVSTCPTDAISLRQLI